MLSRRNRKPRPLQHHEELGQSAAFPKPRRDVQPEDQVDTRGLAHRKIRPDRDDGYKRWLTFRICAIFGLTDQATGQPHVCWSPSTVNGRPKSDPAHAGKSYSGALKRNDSGCMALCRHAHRMQEDNMNEFDRRFGIDRIEIAARLYAEYVNQKGPK